MKLFFKFIAYSIKVYDIVTLEELEQLLKIKKIKCSTKIRKGIVICYYDQGKVVANYINNIIDDKLILENKIIKKPLEYLCVFYERDIIFKRILIFYLCSIFSIISSFYYFKISTIFLVICCLVKCDKVILMINMFIILLLNFIIYDNVFIGLSLIILILSFKYSKIIYLSILPLFIYNNVNAINSLVIYTFFLMLYHVHYVNNSNLLKYKMLKLLLKKPINKIESICIDGEVIDSNGNYFYETSKYTKILVNGINIKFISLESLSDKLKIIYVGNENSFFTNKQKYSKIYSRDKIYLFLYERY
ncbi:MAG: hypothetical protein ACK5NF_06170 [Bacilli bacterium]